MINLYYIIIECLLGNNISYTFNDKTNIYKNKKL
jgi:hypothetical protein